MKLLAAAIFDLDGTLLDTERLSRDGWQWALSKFGYALSNEKYEPSIGRTAEDTCNLWRKEFGSAVPVEEANTLRLQYIDEHLDQLDELIKPGVLPLLDHLEGLNIPMAVATSSDQTFANRKLKASNLLERFPVVVTADQVMQGKPSPDIYLEAAQQLSVKPDQCIVFEDAEDGIKAAYSAGMTVFVVPDLKPPSELSKTMVSGVLRDLENAIVHINKLAEPRGLTLP